MKKILLVLVCMFLCISAFAQTFHAIIFANTKSPGNPNKPGDTGIGPSVTVDFERMGIEMTSIASFIGYNLKKYYYYDSPERFSRNSLEQLLNSITFDKDDIVFFYYSGHGLRAANENSQYPEMVLKVPYGEVSIGELYPLYDVYQKLKSKSPRLTIVFGDLCNSTIKGFYRDYDAGKGTTTKSSTVCDVYKNLFLNVKGGIIASSSKPGQTSGCAKYNDGSQAGGNFTVAFLESLGYYVSQGEEVSWDALLNDARDFTQEISRPDNNGEKQYPVFSTKDLIKVEAPFSTVGQQPSAPISNDAHTTFQDNLSGSLTSIANDLNKPIERIKLISPTLSKYFSSSLTRVQVVGRDCKTIVNTTTADKYLNYLSISTKMEQVMVLEEEKDDKGKVIYLKVHEMHRE